MTWNRERMDRAFGTTPASFGQAMQEALAKCEPRPKKSARRAPAKMIVIAAALALLCGAALAAVNNYGMDWWFTGRWSYIRRLYPALYREVMNCLQTDIPQESSLETDGLRVIVAEAAYLAESGKTYVEIEVENLRPEYEMHPAFNMDVDGALGEEHDLHWLWTKKGFGVPEKVMDDPGKTLLLYEGETLYVPGVDDGKEEGDMLAYSGGCDVVRGEDGRVLILLECWEDIARYADAEGWLHLRLPFSTRTFADDEYGEVIDKGEITFRIDMRR